MRFIVLLLPLLIIGALYGFYIDIIPQFDRVKRFVRMFISILGMWIGAWFSAALSLPGFWWMVISGLLCASLLLFIFGWFIPGRN